MLPRTCFFPALLLLVTEWDIKPGLGLGAYTLGQLTSARSPAVPGSWLGGSEPIISVSQEAHQASQAVLQWKTTCGLMSVHWNRYALTWNFLALTNQFFPVKWRVVRSLMTGSNCHFDDQNLYWPETHNFLAITKDLEQKEKKIEKANQTKTIFCLYSITVKFAELFLVNHVMKKDLAFRAVVLGIHTPPFQSHC